MGEGKISAVIPFVHSNVSLGKGAYTAIANDHSVCCDLERTGKSHCPSGSLAGSTAYESNNDERRVVHLVDTIHGINNETGPDHS